MPIVVLPQLAAKNIQGPRSNKQLSGIHVPDFRRIYATIGQFDGYKFPASERLFQNGLSAHQVAPNQSWAGVICTLSPQPQADVWFGLLNTNRAPSFS